MSDVLWRRLRYMLSPQLDIYKSIANVVKKEQVIDIGCGTGIGTLQLAKRNVVVGIEFDKESLDFANYCFPDVTWVWGDISRGIEYCGHSFDTALLIEVLEHVSDWQAALVHTSDILRPGGRLIISARNTNADLRKNALHEREWSAREFESALLQHFERVELYDYTLQNRVDTTTRQTPLVAIAYKKGATSGS